MSQDTTYHIIVIITPISNNTHLHGKLFTPLKVYSTIIKDGGTITFILQNVYQRANSPITKFKFNPLNQNPKFYQLLQPTLLHLITLMFKITSKLPTPTLTNLIPSTLSQEPLITLNH